MAPIPRGWALAPSLRTSNGNQRLILSAVALADRPSYFWLCFLWFGFWWSVVGSIPLDLPSSCRCFLPPALLRRGPNSAHQYSIVEKVRNDTHQSTL
uniref:Uncharacterized protein n=1 Tax=Physcomitrium patens TaxID=3218 RepID=A0A2K1ID36_PHYPA|nr:hypothetical protein PHYPA_030671 [Physcomitrium patens]